MISLHTAKKTSTFCLLCLDYKILKCCFCVYLSTCDETLEPQLQDTITSAGICLAVIVSETNNTCLENISKYYINTGDTNV